MWCNRTLMDELRRLQTPEGASIAYARWQAAGEGGVLVLLHGLASNRSRWSEFVENSGLKSGWTLLRPDLRGQGESIWRGRIGMDEWCADLAALLAVEGGRPAFIAGHCLGANIALEFATRHPDRVAGLVLIEPMPRQALAGTMRRVARLRPLLLALAGIARILNALGLHRRRVAPLDLQQLDRETRAALAQGAAGKAMLDEYASPLLDLRTTPSAAYLQALAATAGALPRSARVAVPMLVLLSARSEFTDLERTRAFLAAAPDCTIVQLDALHWIPTEQPEQMRIAIEQWVERKHAG